MTTPKQVKTTSTNISLNNSLIDNLKPTVKANADLAKQQSAITTKATISAAKEVANLPANKDISYQILAEPISVFNPEAIINAGIAFVNTIGQAILGSNKEALVRIAELSQTPDTKAQECIDKAGKKCSAIAQNNYKLGQLVNGNILSSAPGVLYNVANSYKVSTDSDINMETPLFGVNSQDSILVANNSITQVADFKSGNYKQELTLVEGSITSQAQNSTYISTETSTHVSKSIEVTGTQLASIKGKSTSIMGDSSIAVVSGGTTNVASVGDTSLQTNGDMFIGATRPNTSEKIAASNVTGNNAIDSAIDTFLPSGGNITIASSIPKASGADADTCVLSFSKLGAVTSSTNNICSVSGGTSVNYGKLANVFATDNICAITNGKNTTFIQGRFNFTGRNVISLSELETLVVKDIPAIPPLPKVPNKQLENCIPQDIKDKKASQDKLKERLRKIREDKLKEKEEEQEDPIVVIPEITYSSNKTKIPKPFTTNSRGNLNQPSVLNSSDNKEIAFCSPYTAINICINKENYKTPVFPSVTELDTTFTLPIVLEQLGNEYELKTSDPEKYITIEYLTSYLIKEVPAKVLNDYLYPQFYIDLISVPTTKLNTFTLTDKDFLKADKVKVNIILNLVKEYPNTKKSIIDIVTQAVTATALGGLIPFVGSIAKVISKNIEVITDISKIPKIIESKQYDKLFDLAKPYATREINHALKGTPFSELLNNTDFFEFGKAITKGDLTKAARDALLRDTVDQVYNKTLKKVLEKTALKELGIDESILPAIKDVLNKAKVGETINPEDYINEIADILIKDKNILNNIKCGVNATKYIAFRQYLESFANRAKIIDTLTNTILQQEVSSAFGILSPLLPLESKRILEKDSFNIIAPVLTNIYNNVKLKEPNDFQNYINEVTSKLNINDSNCKGAAGEIFNSIKGLLEDISKGDILSIISGANTQSLLTTLLGSNNAGSISKIFDLTKSAIGAYNAIKLIPDLINLMNDYKIPALDQVNIALNCLDLFNKIKSLIDSAKALSNKESNNSKPAVALLENAGRLVQAANSINSVDDTTLDDWSNNIGDDYIDLQDIKATLNTNLSLNKCFKVPKLNVFQSEIEVLQIENTALVFKLTNLEVIQDNFNLLPKINELVQIRVQGFYSNSTQDYYVPYQTDYEYTPSVYSFVITSFDIENNVGIAYYDKAYPSIVLENSEGVLYKFASEAIGVTLSPDIVDSYLLA
jgi:hypothetical protein